MQSAPPSRQEIAFQSALPRGERRYEAGSCKGSCHISIRAPARGATRQSRWQPFQRQISIRAPTRGATCANTGADPILPDFNPRSREGSDCMGLVGGGGFQNFNPRSREGSDPLQLNFDPSKMFISIHAPARGATPEPNLHGLFFHISIHAPARGATCASIFAVLVSGISIHAPARGATPTLLNATV